MKAHTAIVCIVATRHYSAAMTCLARRLQAALSHHRGGHFVFATDRSETLKRAVEYTGNIMGPTWKIHHLAMDVQDGASAPHKDGAQFLIAQLYTAVFTRARTICAEVQDPWVLSMESDVLPPAHGVQAMEWALEMPGHDGQPYYQVTTLTYPSQGGGDFLGGRGTVYAPISQDFRDTERKLPAALARKVAELHKASQPIPQELMEKIRQAPPKGNVWLMNGLNGWTKRGWMSAAYPAIGRGAVVPTDWCGFGATMMTPRALDLAMFEGYHPDQGTQDLYIVWHRWYQAGVRIAVIPHAPCDHVIRDPQRPGEMVLCQAYHETEGESAGHMRVHRRRWINYDDGQECPPSPTTGVTTKS